MPDLRLVPPPEPEPTPRIDRDGWWVLAFLVLVLAWVVIVPMFTGDGNAAQPPGYGQCVQDGC